ncbi:MAG: alpha/beta fold hydrolase [Thioclava marina]|uniref:alpha/beta hydrolase n=1 Tax=Thioclava marina TaxID=1915077 RepID=UPI0019A63B67|nr:alpha/beta fold hydrolase [Thioclava marina]MBC7144337.1 alpha/beta fold hydrolase [Thioclava marina]
MADLFLYVAIFGAVLLALRVLVHRALLRGLAAPRIAHEMTPTDLDLGRAEVAQVEIVGPEGARLFGWVITPGGQPETPCPAVLVMHGWGANAAMMLGLAPPLIAAGYAVMFLDARCHGRSDGARFTSMPRFAEDIAAGLAHLRAQEGIDPVRIALIGHSVGAGAVLLHAARARDVCAVVSLSAFANPRELMERWMAEHHIPFRGIGQYILHHVQRVIGARFDEIAPIHTVTQVSCPVLLVHGLEDTTAPFSDAERLQAAAPDAQLLPVHGDHDLRESLHDHEPEIVGFLNAACHPS